MITCAHEHEVGHGGLGVGEAVPGQGEAQVVGDLVRGKGEDQAGVLRVDQVQVRQVGPHIRLEVVQSGEGKKSIEHSCFARIIVKVSKPEYG